MKRIAEEHRIQEILGRSRTWLLEVSATEDESISVSLENLLRILLGVSICEQASQQAVSSTAFNELVKQVEKRIQNESEVGLFDPYNYDAKLLLLCYRILSAHPNCGHHIRNFVQQVAAALSELPTIPLRYTGEALLLAQLGYVEYPPVLPLEADHVSCNALHLLRCEEEEIRVICMNIAAATHFGREILRASADVYSYLRRVLPIILTESLREYNLELGTILMRTIHYLRLPVTRTLRLATLFIIDQQCVNGSFGYFALETRKIELNKDMNSFSATYQLYLPVTVSCLWALAETLVPTFNLFSVPTSSSYTRTLGQ